MAFFDLFRSSGIDEGLRQFENTSGAALLDVRRMGFQHVTNIGGISAYRGKVEY